MATTLYHYANCGTCKKAIAWLTAKGINFKRVDIVATPPSADTLTRLWKSSGLPLERFFNTSGESYRSGSFKDRLPSMTDGQKLAALAADGKLVKRPLLDLGLEVGQATLVGFKEPDWERTLVR
jgi:arsenate reductase